MAEITIRLIYNLETGKKDILIDYHSDADALPIEHEREHREIVAELLGKGILDPAEVGDVRVVRGAHATPGAPAHSSQDQAARQPQAEGDQ